MQNHIPVALQDEDGEVIHEAAFRRIPPFEASRMLRNGAMMARSAVIYAKQAEELQEKFAALTDDDRATESGVQILEQLHALDEQANQVQCAALGMNIAALLVKPFAATDLEAPRSQEADHGLECYRRLFDLGWSHTAIVSLAEACQAAVMQMRKEALEAGMPNLNKVRAKLDFGKPRTGSPNGSSAAIGAGTGGTPTDGETPTTRTAKRRSRSKSSKKTA